MKVHILQHEPFEGIGSMEAWFKEQKAEIHYTRFFEDWTLPALNDLDLIITMGGSMSVNDESSLPWLRLEKKIIREAIERGIAVLGICLGAQLIASAMGAKVYKNPEKEIGWFEIDGLNTKDTFQFPQKFWDKGKKGVSVLGVKGG